MTFQKRHYEYLADTILNDPNIKEPMRRDMYWTLSFWFARDFLNFNKDTWRKRWVDHFHSDSNFQAPPNA
ncbi:hypothetical protein LCGC14_2054970 [marine sediment metagenome]|uniref:Uncharacterized protein n=1 Tax=marine sediment metagenome TaxID=412755 RepID=A0A0F9FAC8_9ZZZZ